MTTRATVNRDVGGGFVEAVIPLMKEYTEKLEACIREADQIHEEYFKWRDSEAPASETKNARQRSRDTSFQHDRLRHFQGRLSRLKKRIRHLSAPVRDLDRRVSQVIEHGQLESDLDRVELKLRLNELETTLDAATHINATLRDPAA